MKKRENIGSIVIIAIVLVILIGIGVGLWLLIRSAVEPAEPQAGSSGQTLQTTGRPSSQATVPTGDSQTVPTQNDPKPTQSVPTEPAPTDPIPTDPTPSETPTEPTQPPTEPTQPVTQPTQPSTVTTAPSQPAACQHSYGQWDILEDATCTKKGIQARYCEICGAEEQKTLDATGHSYGSWKTTKEATCTAKGKKVRTCTDCGEEESKSISATGHSYDGGTAVGDAVSCVQTGTIRYTCANCGDSYDVIRRGSHSFTYNENEGYLSCTLCGDRFYDEYSAEKDIYIPMDPNSALVNDRVTLKENTYTGKLSTWSEQWFEYRTLIYQCMMGHSESYHYGSGPSYPYEHPIRKNCTKEEAEAVRDEFVLFLDDFEDVFGWRPDAPTVEYSNHYQGYCLFFDLKEMYSDYRAQMKKLSAARKEEIELEVTAYLIHSWGVEEGMSVYEASCLISACVWEWAYYDYSLRLHDAIDGFALGSCVCDGYAKMFLRFAEYCGIETQIVTGRNFGQSHAWNKVIFSDGTVRYIDLTNSGMLRREDNMENYKW